MRILMVNKYLYPRAGAETYMLSVARELINRGNEVAFFGMEHPENTSLGRSETIPFLDFGASHGTIKRVKNIAEAIKLSLLGVTSKKLDQLIRDFKPDLIHAHNIYNQLSPALFRRYIGKIPVLMTVHDYKPICPNYNLFVDGETCTRCVGQGVKWCIRKQCCHGSFPVSLLAAISADWHRYRKTYINGYDEFIAPSSFLKSQLVAGGLPEERITVLNNFATPSVDQSPPGVGFFYAGRLCREKGIDTLLRAYALLSETNRPPLTIAGDGPLQTELKSLANEYNLSDIRWLGRIPPEEVERELQACAVTIVPSRWFENCSMAVMESLAAGRPSIVSSSGGSPELIQDGIDGWVFRAGETSALADVLLKVTGTTESELSIMSNAARITSQERFGPQVHLDALEVIYKKMIQQEKDNV